MIHSLIVPACVVSDWFIDFMTSLSERRWAMLPRFSKKMQPTLRENYTSSRGQTEPPGDQLERHVLCVFQYCDSIFSRFLYSFRRCRPTGRLVWSSALSIPGRTLNRRSSFGFVSTPSFTVYDLLATDWLGKLLPCVSYYYYSLEVFTLRFMSLSLSLSFNSSATMSLYSLACYCCVYFFPFHLL